MNILYIIGNGFDINLGIKTRYTDFYNYYKLTDSKSELITKLKKEISEGISNWSDLELAFGKYTINLDNINEFDEVYEDIVDNLADYLNAEEEKFDFSKVRSDKFFNNLYLPEISLTNEDIQELTNYKNHWKSQGWNVNIITLNYTTSIEKILGESISNLQIGGFNGHPVMLRNIQHIHGYTDSRTVMGVNDTSQIDKADFHENEEILEALIKTKCNRVQRHNVDRVCEQYVSKAQLICIFGCSLGDTDNYWWQIIADQLRRDIRIIIFSKGEEIKQRFGQKAARTQRAIKKLFLDKTNLSEDEKKLYEGNIYIGVNTNMFDILY